MSQTKAVRWIGLDCLVLRVNVVSKLLLIFILICIWFYLKCHESKTRGIIHNKKQNKTHETLSKTKHMKLSKKK